LSVFLAKRLSFPQNYKTLSVHPNMSKGKFLYAGVNTVLYRFFSGETFSRCAAEWRNIVLQPGGVADFEALHCQPSRNFHRSTSAPLLAICCYRQFFYF